MHIAIELENRKVEFDMSYDETFQADVNTRTMLSRRSACEPEVAHLMFRVLREGDWVVDGGANIGFFSLLMARLVGPTGRVLAFEPGPNNIEKLRENIALNKLEHVEVIERALWSWDKSEAPFYLAADSGEHAMIKSDVTISKISVSTVKLSGYCRDHKLRLIKLDLEGAEQRALEGAHSHLGRKVPFVVCELNGPALRRMEDSQASLRKLMRGFGYEMFVLHADGRLPSLVPVNAVVEATTPNTNVLFSTPAQVGEIWTVVYA